MNLIWKTQANEHKPKITKQMTSQRQSDAPTTTAKKIRANSNVLRSYLVVWKIYSRERVKVGK